jgi:hypothetical protein
MTKNIQTEKLNAAIDMLIENDTDLSTVLGKEDLKIHNRYDVTA